LALSAGLNFVFYCALSMNLCSIAAASARVAEDLGSILPLSSPRIIPEAIAHASASRA
jgi:hypothetical protein